MKRVLVGISGGVDSSVAAALLKEQGYEVIGLTFIFTEDFNFEDAVKVCEKLNIEHHIMDYKEIFKKTIIDKFIDDYKNGITPNPCVTCNKEVKFNFLYESMIKYNCDYIATGHYAKIINGKLYKSKDLNKDQTYFLASLSKKQLNKVLLPLEGITKDEVRQTAKELGSSVITPEHIVLSILKAKKGLAYDVINSFDINEENLANEIVKPIEKQMPETLLIMKLAKEEARRLGRNVVGTEMFLLGIIAEGASVASEVLCDLEITMKDARFVVESLVGYGNEYFDKEIVFTKRVKRVLERQVNLLYGSNSIYAA